MYNQKQKSNVHLRKKHKTADRKGGGGSTLTVSLTVKYPFFFLTTSLKGSPIKYYHSQALAEDVEVKHALGLDSLEDSLAAISLSNRCIFT